MPDMWGWMMHAIGGFFNYLRSDIVPLAPLIAAVAVVVAGLTYWQKTRNDRSDQNWKRIQWSVDTALSDDEQTRAVGITAVAVVIDDGGIDGRDLAVLRKCLEVTRTEDLESGTLGNVVPGDFAGKRVALSLHEGDVDNESDEEVDDHGADS